MSLSPVTRLLCDLVAIPSVNPMGRDLSGGDFQERHCAEFVAHRMRCLGLDVILQDVTPGRPNVTGRLETPGQPLLLLDSHLDTVPADGMERPFDPVVENGTVRGRGSCDTKASMAVYLTALEELLREGRPLRWSVVLAGTMDEELYATGALALARQGLRPDLAIFGEPTSLHLIHAHKGVMRFHVECRGKSCHSALPELGRNAFYPMAEVLLAIRELGESLAEITHPDLGRSTINPGVLAGGFSVNSVPDRCDVDVDVRLLPGQTSASVLAMLAQALAHLDPGICRVLAPYLDQPAVFTDPQNVSAQALFSACRKHFPACAFRTAPYGTDAQAFGPLGTPCLVFGPGNIAVAHTREEHVRVEELETGVRIMKDFLAA